MCRYDLTSLSGQCPECGWVIDPDVLYLDEVELVARRLQKPAPPSWWRRLLAAYSVALIVFVAAVLLGILGALVWMLTGPDK